jgi:hypothetical protein
MAAAAAAAAAVETHRLTSLRWLFDALNSVASSLQLQYNKQIRNPRKTKIKYKIK